MSLMESSQYTSFSNCEVKLLPWSVKISLGTPTLENKIISSLTTCPVSIDIKGTASSHMVAQTHTTSTNLLALRLRNNGPMMSMAILSKGESTVGNGMRGATACLLRAVFWHSAQPRQYSSTSLKRVSQ